MKRSPTTSTVGRRGPSDVSGLYVVTHCERHQFRRLLPRDARGQRPKQRPCPACRREERGWNPPAALVKDTLASQRREARGT